MVSRYTGILYIRQMNVYVLRVITGRGNYSLIKGGDTQLFMHKSKAECTVYFR